MSDDDLQRDLADVRARMKRIESRLSGRFVPDNRFAFSPDPNQAIATVGPVPVHDHHSVLTGGKPEYAPRDPLDWDNNRDPGNVWDALDQLARRLHGATDNMLCYEYIVDSDGSGTHTQLFGSDGALAAAWLNDKSHVAIWVCPDHVESVTEPTALSGAGHPETITIEAAPPHFESISVRPLFNLDAGTSFITYDTVGGSIGSLQLRNLQFYAAVSGSSFMSGTQNIASKLVCDNAIFALIDYLYDVTTAIRGSEIWLRHSFASGYSSGSALVKTSGTNSHSFSASYYINGIYIVEGSHVEQMELVAGVGVGSGFLSNIVVTDSQLLLDGIDDSWLDFSSGGDYHSGSNTMRPSVRIADNRIIWGVTASRNNPFLKTDTDANLQVSGLVVEGNTALIINPVSDRALSGTFFADLEGSVGPDTVSVKGNTIVQAGGEDGEPLSPGIGTAITVGPNATNTKIDNVYAGFDVNADFGGTEVDPGSVGVGGLLLTVEEEDGDPSVGPVSKLVVPNGSLTDDGSGQVTLAPDRGSVTLWTNPLGTTLVEGDVVAYDAAAADQLNASGYSGDIGIIGVVLDASVPTGEVARVRHGGWTAKVKVHGAVTAGHALRSYASGNLAAEDAGDPNDRPGAILGTFAIALESAVGPGYTTIAAYLIQPPTNPPWTSLLLPPSLLPVTSAPTSVALPDVSTGYVGLVRVDEMIFLKSVQYKVPVAAVGAGAGVRIALFDEDGQLVVFDVTDAVGTGSGVRSVATPSLTLQVGNYYLFVCLSAAAATSQPSLAMQTAEASFNSIGSDAIAAGTLVITGGAAPASFDPAADITPAANSTLYVRFTGD